jgi:hypothetical protein
MKKIILFIITLCLLLVSIVGCNYGNGLYERQEVKFEYVMTDEMLFGNVIQLVESADHVFVGEVENISFAVINDVTGRTPTENCNPDFLTLVTIYDVSVLFSYMGAQQTITRIITPGGVRGYREYEQFSLIMDMGVGAIPIHSSSVYLELGGVYLFVVLDLDIEIDGYNNFVGRVNSLQSFFDLGDPLKSVDNFSDITVKNIINEFGTNAFEEFTQNRQFFRNN